MEATSALAGVYAYIVEFNPSAARRLTMRLRTTADSLADYPERGRLIRPGVRELTTVRPYLIRYEVAEHMVRILSIRHGARRPLR